MVIAPPGKEQRGKGPGRTRVWLSPRPNATRSGLVVQVRPAMIASAWRVSLSSQLSRVSAEFPMVAHDEVVVTNMYVGFKSAWRVSLSSRFSHVSTESHIVAHMR